MSRSKTRPLSWTLLTILILSFPALWATGCSAPSTDPGADETSPVDHYEDDKHEDEWVLTLPELAPISLDGESLRVVATTSIIGDVLAQVGGDEIALTVLLDPGADSHNYQPGAQDLIAVENAHVIFVNGWDLEGGLAGDLETIGGGVLIVPISAGIAPLAPGGDEGVEHEAEYGEEEDDHEHGPADPHVWFDIHNVRLWVDNVEHVLSELDPANAKSYSENAAVFHKELENMEAYVLAQLDRIPPENRFLVTNHDSFAYFARAYGFEVIATVIPAASTLAEPSAGDLVALVEEMEAHGVCTIFTETSVGDALAQTVAAELDACDDVLVIPLYSEALGPPGSGAETYIGMFTSNVDAIVEGLK